MSNGDDNSPDTGSVAPDTGPTSVSTGSADPGSDVGSESGGPSSTPSGGAPGGDAGGGGGGGNAPLATADILKQGGDIAQSTIPFNVAGFLNALNTLRARAQGSTAELMPDIIGQLSDLRGQYAESSRAVSRRLGFSGGGQVERERGRLLGTASRQYANLLAGQQQSALAGQENLLGGFQPLLSGAAAPPSVSTEERFGGNQQLRSGAIFGQSASAIAQLVQDLTRRTTTTGGSGSSADLQGDLFNT